MAKPVVIRKIESAWNSLSKLIDEDHKEFLEDHDEEELADNHFVCWEEADIPFQLGHYFLQNSTDGRFEYHVEMNLKPTNFDGYDFGNDGRLEKVRDKIGRRARIDFLVDNMSGKDFEVVGEAKYFRYSIEGVSRGTESLLETIQGDNEKLETLVAEKIGKYGVYVVLDKWYHRKDPRLWDKALKKFDKMTESGIFVYVKEV